MNEKKKEKNITNAKAEINITEKIQITDNKTGQNFIPTKKIQNLLNELH